MNHIWIIGRNTFTEAVRQKFFHFLLLLATALILSVSYLRGLDFGKSELKFIFDIGFGTMFMFGSILAIITTAQLFFSEIEKKTALTLLAKPLARSEFILGKFFGTAALLLVYTALMASVLAAVLWFREGEVLKNAQEGFQIIDYGGLAMFAGLQALRLFLLSAITLVIASYSNTNLFTVVTGFFVMLISQLQYVATAGYERVDSGIGQWMLWFVSKLFPNFQVFNVGEQIVFVEAAKQASISVAGIAFYGGAYLIVFLGLAVYSFHKREI